MTIERLADRIQRNIEYSERVTELYLNSIRRIQICYKIMGLDISGVDVAKRQIRKNRSGVRSLKKGYADESDGIGMLEDSSTAHGDIAGVWQQIAALKDEEIELQRRDIVIYGELIEICDECIEYDKTDLENKRTRLTKCLKNDDKYRADLAEEKKELKERKKQGNPERIVSCVDVIRHSKRLIASNKDLIKSTKNLIKTYPKRIEGEIKEREDFTERKKKAESELEDLQNDRITTEQNLANAKADLEHSRKVISDLKKNSSDNE